MIMNKIFRIFCGVIFCGSFVVMTGAIWHKFVFTTYEYIIWSYNIMMGLIGIIWTTIVIEENKKDAGKEGE